jgi:predicted phage terminase large subunit-like protein
MRNPSAEILLTSYGDDLIREHSAAARQFYSYWSPKITGRVVSTESKAVDRWLVDAGPAVVGGGVRAVGIMSAVTGRRANYAVIDDPYKNWQEASSVAVRDTVDANYMSAVRTRLLPGGAIVLIHNRWDKDDQTGRLVSRMKDGVGEEWEVLSLPARSLGDDDPLGRPEGAPLWPEFYSEEELQAQELAMSSGPVNFWQALHQQEPESSGGRVFRREWFRYFWVEDTYYVLGGLDGEVRYQKAEVFVFQTVDVNGSSSQRADYFVISTWGLCPGSELILLDVFRRQLGVEDHLGALRDAFALWSPGCQYVENKTFGTNLVASAAADGLPVYPVPAENDKITRATTILARYKCGKVFHRKNGEYLPVVEHELLEFPGRHDDFVDTASIAGIQSVMMYGGSGGGMPAVGGSKREGASLGEVGLWS